MIMDKKDKELQKLFSDYQTEDFPDKKVMIEAKNLINKKKKSKFAVPYFRAATVVCCALILVFVITSKLPQSSSPTLDKPVVVYSNQIIGKKADPESQSFAPWIKSLSQNNNLALYDFKYKNDTDKSADVFLAEYNASSENGYLYIKMYVEGENIEYYKIKDIKNIKNTTEIADTSVYTTMSYLNGEYSTNAYFIKNNFKYSFNIISNDESGAEYHFKEILNFF